MKIALGMIVRNEEKMLRLTLPVYAKQFDIRMALDTGSTDATCDILRDHGFTVLHAKWNDNYSEARNTLLDVGLKIGLDWIVQIDADECLWPQDAKSVLKLCDKSRVAIISFPRVNLAAKGEVQETGSYPDYQARCVAVQSGKRYRLPVHEVIDGQKEAAPFNLYHYGFCKTPEENWTRSRNYELIGAGESSLEVTPKREWPTYDQWLEDMKTRHTFEPFAGEHPLKNKL